MSSLLHINFLKSQAKIFPSIPTKTTPSLVKCTGLHWVVGTLERRVETCRSSERREMLLSRERADRGETSSGPGALLEEKRTIAQKWGMGRRDPENVQWSSWVRIQDRFWNKVVSPVKVGGTCVGIPTPCEGEEGVHWRNETAGLWTSELGSVNCSPLHNSTHPSQCHHNVP